MVALSSIMQLELYQIESFRATDASGHEPGP